MKKEIKYISYLVLLMIVFLSIGYSAFTTSTDIKDISVYVNVINPIRISRFETSSNLSSYATHTKDTATTNINLGENDSITYTIDATNLGRNAMGIYEITGLPNNLEYELTDYNLGDALCDTNNLCVSGITKTFYLTIKYKENGYDSSNTTYTINLSFDFRLMRNITYSNMDSTGYPTRVIDGGNLSLAFTNEIPKTVSVSGAASYTYVEPNLTITDAISDIVISSTKFDYQMFAYNGTDGTDGSIQTFVVPEDGVYKLEVWGAQGGYHISTLDGGYAGYSVGIVSLNKNDNLYINIGGKGLNASDINGAIGGYNGGGNGGNGITASWGETYFGGGAGGGATHIATNNLGELKNYKDNISDILIIAGGGGGASSYSLPGAGGGFKGNISKTDGNCTTEIYSIAGGTQTSGYLFGQGQNGYNRIEANNCGCEGIGGGGGGFYGGTSYQRDGIESSLSGAGGSGYIANTNLYNKKMVCYNCETSTDINTYTESNTCAESDPTPNCSKKGNGYAKITLVESIPTAPVITGGTGDNWVSTAQTITVATEGFADSGLKYYEYYKSTSSTAPTISTVATGTTSKDLTITDEDTTYIWYRTVTNLDNKSEWSSPQVVNLDTTKPTAPTLSIKRESDNYIYGSVSSGTMETILTKSSNVVNSLEVNSVDNDILYYTYTAYLMMNTHKQIPISKGCNSSFCRISYNTNSISSGHILYFDYIVDSIPVSVDFNDFDISFNVVQVNNGYRIFGKYQITEYDVSGTSGGRLYAYDTMRFIDINGVTKIIDDVAYYPISEIHTNNFESKLQVPETENIATYYEIKSVDKAGNISDSTYVLVEKGTAYSVTNLITNGSFENGINGWDTNNSKNYSIINEGYSGTYSLKYNLIHIADYSDFGVAVQFLNEDSLIINHKYYSSYMFKTTVNNYSCPGNFEIYGNTVFGENQTTLSSWTKLSGLISLTYKVGASDHFRSYIFNTSKCSSNDVFSDDFILIDLTTTFGAGNEPSQEWCDKHIDYFDGTTTIYK